MKSRNSIHTLRCHRWRKTSRHGRARFPVVRVCTRTAVGCPDAAQNGYPARSHSARRTFKSFWRAWSIATPRSVSQTRAVCFTSFKVREIMMCASPCYSLTSPSGTFAETTSPEDQLHWIVENCKVVRTANGLSNIVEAIKIASSKHDLLW